MSKKRNDVKKYLKKFWNFLWYDDSFLSFLLNLVLAFIVIKFIFFPVVGFLLSTSYPIVAIVSGSMEHDITDHRICNYHIKKIQDKDLTQDEWWRYCGKYYEKNYNLSLEEFSKFDYAKGLNKGDVIILYGKEPQDIDLGEILVFIPQNREFYEKKGPVIHRVMKKWQDEEDEWHFQTKGDHNPSSRRGFEQNIPQEDVIGIGVVRIPYIGYPKLVLNEGIVFFARLM